ncbi:MAG: hypothetical protein U5P41_07910 [Gammaproteobacteria bacterium]|nr:hypothetical protein [Gammaproteobacteria bacterium]
MTAALPLCKLGRQILDATGNHVNKVYNQGHTHGKQPRACCAQATAEVRDSICDHVAMKLAEKGYHDVSPATLNFLGALDCGVKNHGSEIAP